MNKKLIHVLIFIILIVVTLSAYWLKSNLGIEFSKKYSLSNFFPFNYFAPHRVIKNQIPGVILNDSFDSFSLFGNWDPFWMREKGKVTKKLDANGVDNSHCLLVKSSSTKSWSLSHRNIIKVESGDVFSFQIAIRLDGEDLIAQAGVTASDENMSVVSRNLVKENTDIINEWIIVEKRFTIPDKISYIRFTLSGNGVGEFRFDDVVFKKIHTSH